MPRARPDGRKRRPRPLFGRAMTFLGGIMRSNRLGRRICLLLGIVIAGASAAPALAGPDFDTATTVQIGELKTAPLGTTPDGSGEPMTPSSTFYCPYGTQQVKALNTQWFKFRTTGRQLTATMNSGPNPYPLLATRYEAQASGPGNPLLCRWDVPDTPIDQFTLTWNAAADKSHYLQIGKCQVSPAPDPCAAYGPGGEASLKITSTPPADDNRANARAVVPTPGAQDIFDLHGSGEESGERLTCVKGGGPLRSTVWARYTAPRHGTATFTTHPETSDPLEPVIQVYRGSDGTPFDCADPTGGAHASLAINVTTGAEYLIQIGASTDQTATEPQGTFDLDVQFSTTDGDGDGDGDGSDCAPDDPSRFHGNPDVFNNNVDEDCDGKDDKDFDNDGFDFKPAGPDCNDRNGAINPRASEIRGNRKDENCDGKRPAARLSPSPDIQLFSTLFPGRGRIFGDTRIASVAKRYRIVLKCKGSGCGDRKRKTIKVKKAGSVRTKWTTGAVLAPGARFEIAVTLPRANRIGVYQRSAVGPGNVARTRSCDLAPKTVAGRAFKRVRCSNK